MAGVIDHRFNDRPPSYFEMEKHHGKLEEKLYNVDDKIKSTVVELEDARQELNKVKTFNRALEKKVRESDSERKSVQAKIDSMKAKLGVSTGNVNRFNEEKERLRVNLNESQVLVARLEERLTAAASELDRLRDPANPESNMSIKKHVGLDKKEIKRLKVEVEREQNDLEADIETSNANEADVKNLDMVLAQTKQELERCKAERSEILDEESEERRKKEEIVELYRLLKIERTTFEQRLKDARIKLGVKLAGKNVNMKLAEEMKNNEKDLQKQLNSMEKKLREATSDLDILKNRHRMSKTALSINNYTRRTTKNGSVGSTTSMASSGLGNVQFSTKKEKRDTNGRIVAATRMSLPDRLSDGAQNKPKIGSLTDRTQRKDVKSDMKTGASTDRPKGMKDKDTDKQKAESRRQGSLGKGDRKPSVQFVPPPKAKLTGKS